MKASEPEGLGTGRGADEDPEGAEDGPASRGRGKDQALGLVPVGSGGFTVTLGVIEG